MARCSRCKQQRQPLHKFKGFLDCEPCRREIAGSPGIPVRGLWSGFHDLVNKIWDFSTRFFDRIQGIKQIELKESRRPQRPTNKFAIVRPSKLVRIGGDYQKV